MYFFVTTNKQVFFFKNGGHESFLGVGVGTDTTSVLGLR